ncbi:MAG: hypothetical protein ACRDTF_00645 [Pseudonocardiaceae bacterium]
MAAALWAALDELLEDPGAYHAASRAAPARVAAFDPAQAARVLLEAAHIF